MAPLAEKSHPVLADLGITAAETQSPVQTATPRSMSEISDISASSTPADNTPGPSINTQSPQGGAASFSSHQHQFLKRPGGLADSPNARSKTITMADGENTFGALNRHPQAATPVAGRSTFPHFKIGVSEDRNRKCRRTMEDSHSFVYDYAGVKGQGYFAVFDGHAGKHAAEWCGQNFHEWLLDCLIENPTSPVPDLLNHTFHKVDSRLSLLASQDNTHSGCTAVTAFLRVEAVSDGKGFTHPDLESRGLLHGRGVEELERLTSLRSAHVGGKAISNDSSSQPTQGVARRSSGRRLKDFVRGLTTSKAEKDAPASALADEPMPDASEEATASLNSTGSGETEEGGDAGETKMIIADGTTKVDLVEPKSEGGLRRVLYTANVGDARAVLCRGGKAVRLTYDHKGSDAQEAKRITDAGGFVMNNRVNGVLAVTRSLGDSSMKEFVVGSPYTTETTLDEDDEFLIVACDGLWDVTEDQDAINLIRQTADPQQASKVLLDYAMQNYSTDNLSVMVVRFKNI